MKLDRALRFAFAFLIIVVFFIAIGALLFFTQTALNVWDRLAEGPRVILWAYVGAMVAADRARDLPDLAPRHPPVSEACEKGGSKAAEQS